MKKISLALYALFFAFTVFVVGCGTDHETSNPTIIGPTHKMEEAPATFKKKDLGLFWQTDLYCSVVPRANLTVDNYVEMSNMVLASDGTDDSLEIFPASFKGPKLKMTHKDNCDGVPVFADVQGGTAYVTASAPMTLTFISYKKDGMFVLPQIVEDYAIKRFSGAESEVWEVGLPQ